MPVEILVVDTKYYTEFKNDVGWVSVLTDFTPNLAGSVMERVKLVRTINVQWFFSASTSNTISTISLGGGLVQVTRSTGLWISDSLSIGDEISFTYTDNSGTSTVSGTITAITGSVMIISGSIPISSSNGFVNASVRIRGLEPQTALIYKFGLLGNTETFNTTSKVSGNNQAYYGDNIGFDTGGGVRDTNFVVLNRLGLYEDWRTGLVRCRYVQNPLTHIQQFEVEHEFIINPYFLDGELSNLQNNVIPALLAGNNSLKYVFDAEFRTVLSNPNTAKPKRYEESLGAVAWFNESLNGFNSDYNIKSVTYEEKITSAPASGILIGGETRIRVTLERLSGAFVGAERFGAYISYLPEQAEYTNTTLSNLTDNFIYDNALNSAGLPPVGNTPPRFIKALSGTIVGGDLEIIIDVEYTTTQKAFLAGKLAAQATYFLLGIQAGDNTLTNAGSDRIILLADVELFDQSPDIADLMHVTKYDIYPHNEQIGIGTGFTDVTSWNEDGLVVDYEFDLNLNLEAELNTLNFILVAFNPVTNQFWEIDSFAFSPATSIVSNGVQQIILTADHNYILKNGDQFNDITISVGTQTAGLQKYSGRFSQKISWQEWISNLGVDTAFFDANEPNNNFNDKSSNYSALNGYEIKMGIFSNLSGKSPLGVTGLTDYLFLSPNIRVYDYEEDGNIPPVWSCVIETFDAINSTPLSGAILSGVDTLLKVTWTNSVAPVTSLATIWGINRIEETGQTGYAIAEMSSLNLPKPAGQQLLKPSVGTLLDMNIVSGTVVMECLIDGNLVIPGIGLNLSSRIHDTESTGEANGKLTSPDSIQKDTSGTPESKVTAP